MKPETLQLIKNLARGIVFLSVVALLVWGSWHVVRLPYFTIDEVIVTGGETISHQVVQENVEALLVGDYWQFVPRRFAFTYPHQEIVTTLAARPRVKDPQVQRSGKRLQVTLAEFEPVALWCDSGEATTTPCVFLDENGFGFAQAPLLLGSTYVRFVRVGEAATTGEIFADSTDFAQLRTLEVLLQTYGWPVARIEYDQARDAFVYLAAGGELKVSLQLTPEATMDNLETILGAADYQHFKPGNFSYIDLRFGNKVFVNEFGDPDELLEPDALLETASSSVELETEIE